MRMRPIRLAGVLCLAWVVAGCGGLRHAGDRPAGEALAQSGKETKTDSQSLALQAGGLAILTPTAASGHEEDRQTVAMIFATALAEQRPDLSAIPMATALSAINAAGLADTYAHMYLAYKDTGLFDAALVHRIGQAIGARYLVQLKLASFDQSGGGGMFSFMGLSLGHQQTATVRLFAQLWDSVEGRIVWERSNEASERKRSLIRTRTIKMEDVVKSDAEALIKELPHG
jgi:hypothetical protein